MIRLFHSPLSPFCRKVRLSLAEKRLEVELVEERYWERNEKFLKRNPAGKVPVLELGDLTLTESGAICEYLEDLCPEPSLMPSDPGQRYEARRIASWFDDTFHKEVTSKLLYERVYNKLSGRGHPDSGNVKSGLRAIKEKTKYVNGLLETRNWIAGDRMTLADFAAAAHVSSLDYISDIDWPQAPAVKDWYAKIKSRPAFRGILADLVTGFVPSEHFAALDF